MAWHGIKVHYSLTNPNLPSGLPAVEQGWSSSFPSCKKPFHKEQNPLTCKPSAGGKDSSYAHKFNTGGRRRNRKKAKDWHTSIQTAVWHRSGVLGVRCNLEEFRSGVPEYFNSVYMYRYITVFPHTHRHENPTVALHVAVGVRVQQCSSGRRAVLLHQKVFRENFEHCSSKAIPAVQTWGRWTSLNLN